VKCAIFPNVNHTQICSCNQPVLSHDGKDSCPKKQWEPLMVKTD